MDERHPAVATSPKTAKAAETVTALQIHLSCDARPLRACGQSRFLRLSRRNMCRGRCSAHAGSGLDGSDLQLDMPSAMSIFRRRRARALRGLELVWVFGAFGAACNAKSAPEPGHSPLASPSGDSAITASTASSSSRAESPFGPTVENAKAAPGPAPKGMVWIPGGEFSMGTQSTKSADGAGGCGDPLADAEPVHRVYVDGFWMDATEVTNEEFEKFVRATGYLTVAERAPTAEEYPSARPENLVAGSVVFDPPPRPVPLDNHFQWWSYIVRASWRHPLGPASDIRSKEHHPVVHVAFEDAVAYAKWTGKRLPTEAEFEFAARGGLAGKPYVWGDEPTPGGRWMANTFQGHFPDRDTAEDGWKGIAPVASFPPNGYGLYDVAGNVWEWIGDWYRPDAYALFETGGVARNPRGPESSFDPEEPGVAKRVQRGGSFLCTDQYCTRYLVASRGKGEPSSGANHLGFRCVRAP